MVANHYDVIVVGARCAGSPTAMLLARQGYRVLLVDRTTFPSDTISTHVIHPTGIAALNRWGLLDKLLPTGCPPVGTYAFDFGPFTIAGSPGTDDSPVAYAPRRTVLDKLLVDAAASAGAEVREEFTVQEVLTDGGRVTGIRGRGQGGHVVSEHARVVIGADGLHSVVAAAVGPPHYHDKPPLLCGYYAYWSGLPMAGRFENYIRPHRGWGACPTQDDLTVVVVGWPYAEFAANKTDIEGNYLKTFDLAPEFAEDSAPPAEKRALSAPPFPTTSANPMVPAGPWSAMRATTRTPSPRRVSLTPSGTPNCAPPRWTRHWPAPAPSARRWAATRPPGTNTSCRCSSSPPSSPPSNPRRRNSATSSPPFTATKRPWTASHGPTQA